MLAILIFLLYNGNPNGEKGRKSKKQGESIMRTKGIVLLESNAAVLSQLKDSIEQAEDFHLLHYNQIEFLLLV